LWWARFHTFTAPATGLIDFSCHRVGLPRTSVPPGPNDLAELREQRVLYGPLFRRLRDAEIDYLGSRRAVLLLDEHVQQAQVTVDQTLLMRMLDGAADREE
jgi:hypothetical protein